MEKLTGKLRVISDHIEDVRHRTVWDDYPPRNVIDDVRALSVQMLALVQYVAELERTHPSYATIPLAASDVPRLCEYEDCDEYPVAGRTLCAAHILLNEEEGHAQQLRSAGA